MKEAKVSTLDTSNSANIPTRTVITAIVVIALCALSFWGGASYQKHHTSSATPANALGESGFGAGGGRFGGQRPIIGTVSAVSPTSITVNNSFGGGTTTASITSATTVLNGGQPATVADIQVGSTVLVRKTSSTSTQASRIEINPTLGGGPGAAAAGGSNALTN